MPFTGSFGAAERFEGLVVYTIQLRPSTFACARLPDFSAVDGAVSLRRVTFLRRQESYQRTGLRGASGKRAPLGIPPPHRCNCGTGLRCFSPQLLGFLKGEAEKMLLVVDVSPRPL